MSVDHTAGGFDSLSEAVVTCTTAPLDYESARVVGLAVDRLEVRLSGEFADHAVFALLAERRREARGRRSPVPVELGGRQLLLMDWEHSDRSGRYRFSLRSDHGTTVRIANRRMWVSFAKRPLWAEVPPAALWRDLRGWAQLLSSSPVIAKVSRLDLACDVAGWHLDQTDDERFIKPSRVRYRHDMNADRSFGGITFGVKKGGQPPFQVQLYRKDIDTQGRQDAEWIRERWNEAGWQEPDPIWRVEARYLTPAKIRGVLPDVQPESVLSALPELWEYAVGGETKRGWLRFVDRTGDSNQSRWPTNPVWGVVQNASWCVGPRALPEPTPVSNIDQLVLTIGGLLQRLGAEEGGGDTETALMLWRGRYRALSEGQSFRSRVEGKRDAQPHLRGRRLATFRTLKIEAERQLILELRESAQRLGSWTAAAGSLGLESMPLPPSHDLPGRARYEAARRLRRRAACMDGFLPDPWRAAVPAGVNDPE